MDPKALGNQPAVPFAAVEEEVTVKNQYPGLTKRELVAGLALTGLLADSKLQGPHEARARQAVLAADALLAELAKGGVL